MNQILALQRLSPEEPIDGCKSSVSCDSNQSCPSWFSTLAAV